MGEIHEGICGPHMSGTMMAKKILRQGYYWTTMEADYASYVRRCYKCQTHTDHLRIPPKELYIMTFPWSFSTWGIDFIGV